jgi:hypothetical protein
MDDNNRPKTCRTSQRVKIIGGVVIVLSALTMIGELGIALQALGLLGPKPTMHEMSAFTYGSAPGFVLYGALGIATGIGLLRAWRWARVSIVPPENSVRPMAEVIRANELKTQPACGSPESRERHLPMYVCK